MSGSVRPAADRQPGGAAGRRRAVALVVAVLVGAGCCAAAAALTWWTAEFSDPLTGRLTTSAKGSEVLPELVPVALLALAALGATAATRGWPRRVVGALLVVGGLVVAVRSVLAAGTVPDSLHTALTRPATPLRAPQLHPVGVVLATVGGLLVAAGGVLVIAGAGRARAMGARYDRSSRRAAGAVAAGDDPAALWRALDSGADPTAPGADADAGTDPVTRQHPGPIP